MKKPAFSVAIRTKFPWAAVSECLSVWPVTYV